MSRWLSAAISTNLFICYDIDTRTYKTYPVLKKIFEEILPFQQDTKTQAAIDEVITDFPYNRTNISYTVDVDGKDFICDIFTDRDEEGEARVYSHALTRRVVDLNITSIKNCAAVVINEKEYLPAEAHSIDELGSYVDTKDKRSNFIIAEIVAENTAS